jgi:hypothetical protein
VAGEGKVKISENKTTWVGGDGFGADLLVRASVLARHSGGTMLEPKLDLFPTATARRKDGACKSALALEAAIFGRAREATPRLVLPELLLPLGEQVDAAVPDLMPMPLHMPMPRLVL